MSKLSALLDPIFSKILDKYVYSWYYVISKDTLFPSQCEQVGNSVIYELEKRLSRQDLTNLLYHEIPFLLTEHVKNVEEAQQRTVIPQGQFLNVDRIYHNLHPHIALDREENELIYCRLIMEDICRHLLPAVNAKSEIEYVILREALATQVYKAIQNFSDHEKMYKGILLLSNALQRPSTDSWVLSVRRFGYWTLRAIKIISTTRTLPYYSTSWFRFYFQLFTKQVSQVPFDETKRLVFTTLFYPWIVLLSTFFFGILTCFFIANEFYDKGASERWSNFVLNRISEAEKSSTSSQYTSSTSTKEYRRQSKSSSTKASQRQRKQSVASKSLHELSMKYIRSEGTNDSPSTISSERRKSLLFTDSTFPDNNASIALSTVTSTPVFSTSPSQSSNTTRDNLLSFVPSKLQSVSKENKSSETKHNRTASTPTDTHKPDPSPMTDVMVTKQAALEAYAKLPVLPSLIAPEKLASLVDSDYRNKHIFYSLLNTLTVVMFPETRHEEL
ncbi:PXA domain-containing protein Pxa1 [Schizosaccharomyces cryophilus OY26]|uniref:PXA domain-containing protein Pxa1 n=1 Tax=Schizosaccharomyces cryophilus (strain OY26 / ATCC MYA-4695 / CBS 11777 / NBRC 106824 / NRRL Y48691) TaxID=653667 RepID=S9X1K3_SCHCR|nr:PXA domain-containing protein Pxa1 [Schizosaccharomyces cryophilus OY26]EPY50982.1 PXA domain-containing protein Pxa1 [Schizosaccharomyces cryophilus OY26]